MTTHDLHQPEVHASADLVGAAAALRDADRVLIAAGAGLSAAAGYDYSDRTSFIKLFPALHRAGFNARYELIGYPLPARHQWGFWAVHVRDVRLGTDPSPTYRRLREVVGERDHFVMSSNVDALFSRNGFDASRVFTPQGDYALYQCLAPCTRQVWDARPVLEEAYNTLEHRTGQVAETAVPACPNCGGEVYLNVNAGRWYIADHFWPTGQALNGWLANARALARDGQRLVILDVGSGYNTPGVIRWQAERVGRAIPNATLVRLNRDHPEVPQDLAERAYSISSDAADVIREFAAPEGADE